MEYTYAHIDLVMVQLKQSLPSPITICIDLITYEI